ncbi:hypothetical protein LWI28_007674 [Acer negundo]|uniref:Protein kinase domain-containing protein n=1 Tax=Acer negundo TaxID=4023 RepID=A0AAD5NV31_ACENE|nr:hypothetical protein LWI28_007674 [Acer negundo]
MSFGDFIMETEVKDCNGDSHTFAYLHIGFPRPIVYSWMNPSHFLLDEHGVPKLIDFSVAQCIPEGETQIKDARVTGAYGYIAPELFKGVLDEKCDVYGFGSLLLELLTGQRAYDILKTKSNNWFIEAVDPIIVGDGLCPEIEQQLKVFWELAVKCRSDSGEDRPTMIDAAKQLRQLYLSTS